ncbi:MAG: hypothetical protein ACNS63_05560 [Candidatus Nitrospinota bacterium M3_3B_026]
MSEEVMTAAKWARHFNVSDKKFKDAAKAASIEPDSKRGRCAYYSKKTAEKIVKKIK